MNVKEKYKDHYIDYCEIFTEAPNKYEWAAREIFGLTTYDGYLDELFVKKIIEVSKVILKRQTFEYIKDENNYITYIVVCQLFEHFNWIDWGTSIRGAWFDGQERHNEKAKAILDVNITACGGGEIPFTRDNLKALIEFIEED